MYPPLRNYIFPRALALGLPTFPSRYYLHAKPLTHYHRARSLGPVHTKRRRHLTIPAPFRCHLFHIDFVLIVLPDIGFASSTTPHSIASDPAEEEALLCLEQGTQKLEEGDVEGAKKLYQRSVDIKRNASCLFNLCVTHYHLSSYSKLELIVAFRNSTPFERSLTKLSILGHPLLSSNHPAQMPIPVRTFLLVPIVSTQHPQTWRART
jgi:hypothetical protein